MYLRGRQYIEFESESFFFFLYTLLDKLGGCGLKCLGATKATRYLYTIVHAIVGCAISDLYLLISIIKVMPLNSMDYIQFNTLEKNKMKLKMIFFYF